MNDADSRPPSRPVPAARLQRLHALADAIQEIVWSADASGVMDYCNRRAFEYAGIEPQDPPRFNWLAAIHPDDYAQAAAAWQQAVTAGEDWVIELRLRRADGEYRWHLVQANAVRDPRGAVRRWVGIAADIHDGKLAEERMLAALGRAGQHLAETEAVLAALQDAVIIYDEALRVVRVTPSFSTEFGFDPVGLDLPAFAARLECRWTDGRPCTSEDLRALSSARGQRATRGRVLLRRADGTQGVVEISSAPLVVGGRVAGWVTAGHDVTERAAAEDALRESELQFRAVFEHLPSALIVVRAARDRSGRITGWTCDAANQLTLDALGLEREQLVGARPGSLVPQFAFDEARWEEVLATGEPWRGEERTSGRDYLVTTFRMGPDTIGSTALDITERKRAESEAREANRLKDDFIATLSHELRTPLNAILGWVQMARRGVLDEEQRERAWATVERNARAQAGILRDMLDISRIVANKLVLESADVPLAGVIERVVETMSPVAAERRVEIHVAIEAPGAVVVGDAGRLEQVVWNLLSNALKFAPEGRVDVRLEPAPGNSVHVVVRDTGVGIRPDLLPYVFDRFRQGDSSTTRPQGGLGLGLAIVKHLVEAHGGTVWAESEGVGKGTTVTVRLPVKSSPAVSDDRKEEAGPVSLLGARVLVVDDHEDSRHLLELLLRQRGASVHGAASADQAVHLQAVAPADVVLIDIAMPVEDGFVCLRRLREEAERLGRPLAAIAVTSHARREDRQRALEAGFADHIAKPVDADVLVRAVATALGRS